MCMLTSKYIIFEDFAKFIHFFLQLQGVLFGALPILQAE